MSSESPDIVIYDVNGLPMAVQNATAIPASTSALIVAGSDGTNSRYILLDSSGRQIVVGAGTAGSPTGGVLTIQGITGGTNVPVVYMDAQTAETTTAWTSATGVNTALQLTVTGYATVAITFNQTTTITGGQVTFEVSDTVAGTNWYSISVTDTNTAIPFVIPNSTYTLTANTNIAFQVNIAGFVQFRIRLSTVISGSGTVNVGVAANASAAEWESYVLISDGTNGPAGVAPASTAALATQAAQVVALSPASPIFTDTFPAATNLTQTDGTSPTINFGAFGQVSYVYNFGSQPPGSVVNMTNNGYESAVVEVTGTWTGIISVEGINDTIGYWYPLQVVQPGIVSSSSQFSSNFFGKVNIAGFTKIRVRAPSVIFVPGQGIIYPIFTGTAAVQLSATVNQANVSIDNWPALEPMPNTQVRLSPTVPQLPTNYSIERTKIAIGDYGQDRGDISNDGGRGLPVEMFTERRLQEEQYLRETDLQIRSLNSRGSERTPTIFFSRTGREGRI